MPRDDQPDMQKQLEAAKALLWNLREEFKEEDHELIHDVLEGETDLFEAIDVTWDIMAGIQEMLDGAAKRKEAIETRMSRYTKRIARMRVMIQQAVELTGEKKIVRPDVTFSLKKNADKLEITEERLLPAKFFKRAKPTVDKVALKAALKELPEGEAMAGAQLVAVPPSLTVRTK